MCGGTTVFIEFGSGRPAQAVLANPVALAGRRRRRRRTAGPGRPVVGTPAEDPCLDARHRPRGGRSCGSSSGSVFCAFEPRSILGQTCGAHRVRRASHNHRVNQ
ncbi:hypothetical protein LUX57_31530 [Actinomadura madurae]|uniref:hypothetical protein n=1 Tax=Actinomadura madurae TaxID=1993 RepID=UPI0020D2233E|nr:hypothetical protein [Actinomadura madurae]MCP9969153.1 hypothetical protein [Actinomadura madurae]